MHNPLLITRNNVANEALSRNLASGTYVDNLSFDARNARTVRDCYVCLIWFVVNSSEATGSLDPVLAPPVSRFWIFRARLLFLM